MDKLDLKAPASVAPLLGSDHYKEIYGSKNGFFCPAGSVFLPKPFTPLSGKMLNCFHLQRRKKNSLEVIRQKTFLSMNLTGDLEVKQSKGAVCRI